MFYKDARFLPEIDKKTGYVTRSILCLPILNRQGGVVGVAEMVNKKGDNTNGFTDTDEEVEQCISACVGQAFSFKPELFMTLQYSNKWQHSQIVGITQRVRLFLHFLFDSTRGYCLIQHLTCSAATANSIELFPIKYN